MSDENAFLIIPAYIANHSEIDAYTAILFGRLNSLSNKYGCCFASDKYLASISGCKDRVITDRLKKLKDLGFIQIFTKKDGFSWKRRIFTCNHYAAIPEDIQNMFTKGMSVPLEGHERAPYNNKLYNTYPFDSDPPSSSLCSEEEESCLSRPKRKKPSASPPSADAEKIYDFFLRKLKERRKTFKDPKKEKWCAEIDKMLNQDKRSVEEVLEIIEWVIKDLFWRTVILSPSKLREKFDELVLKRDGQRVREAYEFNKGYAMVFFTQNKEVLKGKFMMTNNGVVNKESCKDVDFSLSTDVFKEQLKRIFGGE
jgi:hypothetical protein